MESEDISEVQRPKRVPTTPLQISARLGDIFVSRSTMTSRLLAALDMVSHSLLEAFPSLAGASGTAAGGQGGLQPTQKIPGSYFTNHPPLSPSTPASSTLSS